jgi:uncharacterized protein (TIGR03437 family)
MRRSCSFLPIGAALGAGLLSAWTAHAADSPLRFIKTFGGSGADAISALTTDPTGNVIAAGTTNSFDFPVTNGSSNTATHFAVSADAGGSWHSRGNLPSGPPLALAADTSSPPVWYAAAADDLYKSSDAGTTWRSIGPKGLNDCSGYSASCGISNLVVDPVHPSTIYGSGAAGILETLDAGATWSFANAPISRNPPAYLVLDPFHPSHLFTNINQNDYRSFDGGQNWTEFTPPLLHPENYCSAGKAQVAFDAATPNVVYIVDHCDLFRSTDGGIYWDPITTPFAISYYIVAHPTQGGAIYVSSFNGLYASPDAGVTWTPLLANSQGNPPRVLIIDPQQPSVILTDTARSQDGGMTWQMLALGRPVQSIVFDPRTAGRAIAATSPGSTAFLTKLDATGAILASTYFGGQGQTNISGIATDAAGSIYITGSTTSPDFPAPPTLAASMFVAKFDSDLNLLYAALLGGQGRTAGIAVDSGGSAVVTGSVFGGAYGTCFAAKLSPDGAHTLFFTRFGGTGGDQCAAVAADDAGNTIVAGMTLSKDFPLVGNPPSTSLHGYADAIVAKLDPSGSLIFSGYLGGGDRDSATAVAVDAAGNIYVAGDTASADFPTSAGAYQTALRSNCPYPSSAVATGFIGAIYEYNTGDAFVTKLNSNGSPIFSTYLGGGCYDQAIAIALDPSSNVWILGSTNSDPFPQVMPFQSGPAYSDYKQFASELSADGGSLMLSSYIDSGQSIAVDSNGAAYIGGNSAPARSTYGALQTAPASAGGNHALLAKVTPQSRDALSITSVGNAFNLRSGPVSPGQLTLISAAGIAPAQAIDLGLSPATSLPVTLAGTQVLFDGEAAPLISVGNGTVVAVAPYNLAGKAQTSVQVVFQGAATALVLADVRSDIGYRSANGAGSGPAYALNADGTLNSPSNPSPAGSPVTAFLTGVGVADPACPEGGVAGGDPTVGVPALQGLASVPGSVCGLFEVTITAPSYPTPTTFMLPGSQVTIAVK